MFFDEVTIEIEAGRGGNGCVSFRREKFVPRGGPDGGNGGRGGHVHLVVDPQLSTLASFRRQRHFKAGAGGHGQGHKKRGKQGKDLEISVPPGTLVHDAESGSLIADLTDADARVRIAEGGRGGRGNAAFKSSVRRAPRLAEKGAPAGSRRLRLELRLLADVGIIGAPNAGKSTLLAAVTSARPKIADYPFTTLSPNLGVVDLEDRSLVLVDIPGLIEGAHHGAGLGDQFLRHISRTRALIHLLDGAAEDPFALYDSINRELDLFSARLGRLPQIVAYNKVDLPEAQARWPGVRDALKKRGLEAETISALKREGVRQLMLRAADLMESLPEVEPEEPFGVFRLEAEPFTVEREDGTFRVRGSEVERVVAMTDWRYDEGIHLLHRRLKAMGVTQALEEAGVRPGDTVVVGKRELVWWEHPEGSV
ncbi:MAG: GTPase ObgE [Anaerolineae bacterium]